MSINIGIINFNIDPEFMRYLINEYNNSPHSTFRKYLKRDITPNEMDNNPLLEDKLVYQLTKANFLIRNQEDYDVNNQYVRIMNEAALFDKGKSKLLPGRFKVIGRDNNLFICSNGNYSIKVPRYMIKF